MVQRKTTVERAFELARSNECHTLADIKRVLTAEQHANVEAHLTAPSLRKQLTGLMH